MKPIFKEVKARKKVIPLPRLIKKAQDVFNAWIRKRDEGRGCISCGSAVTEAGHYLSAGHNSALRFNEVNTNGQCTRCNCFMHGNLIEYRKGLVKKYGEEKVFMLESISHRIKRWIRFELEAIIQEYRLTDAKKVGATPFVK